MAQISQKSQNQKSSDSDQVQLGQNPQTSIQNDQQNLVQNNKQQSENKKEQVQNEKEKKQCFKKGRKLNSIVQDTNKIKKYSSGKQFSTTNSLHQQKNTSTYFIGNNNYNSQNQSKSKINIDICGKQQGFCYNIGSSSLQQSTYAFSIPKEKRFRTYNGLDQEFQKNYKINEKEFNKSKNCSQINLEKNLESPNNSQQYKLGGFSQQLKSSKQLFFGNSQRQVFSKYLLKQAENSPSAQDYHQNRKLSNLNGAKNFGSSHMSINLYGSLTPGAGEQIVKPTRNSNVPIGKEKKYDISKTPYINNPGPIYKLSSPFDKYEKQVYINKKNQLQNRIQIRNSLLKVRNHQL
ncbi:hypothetical protein PPERSA_05440 [Pseudocohnilembus persalinus]|uniref:Uncharacterized protein n=1 Tax=Pseudocohnilembus persalinus TaxID=266149 RepID=A0A0V0R7Z3_PSEPJ|nr:hypothetical protein PPERSA_05440 [Pseudocohnilembus persalinus]|eukprot:KRX10620.1 hypothetical protein PPERSA_05440 [Pseudocohnilembus persalinus]